MRQQDQNSAAPVVAATTIGSALGHVAAKLDTWKRQRAEIASELQQLVQQGQRMLADLGHAILPTPDVAPVRKGGRPKGYRTSAATKAKLRAAWRARKAAADQVETPKKRTISADGKARIAAAQRKRWAKVRTTKG